MNSIQIDRTYTKFVNLFKLCGLVLLIQGMECLFSDPGWDAGWEGVLGGNRWMICDPKCTNESVLDQCDPLSRCPTRLFADPTKSGSNMSRFVYYTAYMMCSYTRYVPFCEKKHAFPCVRQNQRGLEKWFVCNSRCDRRFL